MNTLSNLDLEILLHSKSFRNLTAEERNFVLDSMDGDEYERLRSLLQKSRAALQNSPAPNPAIRQNLLAAMRRQQMAPKPKPGLLVQMLHYRIPAWQAAAAVAAVLGLFFWLKNDPLPIQTEKVYVNLVDTIYKEVALPTILDTALNALPVRVNVKPRPSRRTAKPAPEAIAVSDSSARSFRYPDVPDTLPGVHINPGQPKGRPANEMREMWRFFERVN